MRVPTRLEICLWLVPASGAKAQIVIDVNHGTLTLASDDSFPCTIGPSFHGSDHFVYRASAAGTTSVDTTVALTACDGGPEIFTCWNENAFRVEDMMNCTVLAGRKFE